MRTIVLGLLLSVGLASCSTSPGSALTEAQGSLDRQALALSSSSPGYSAVYRAAKKHGVNPSFALAIARIESGGNCKVVSPKGARGVMQVMPGTAKPHGVSRSRLMTCEGSAEAGVKELKRLLAHPKVRGDRRLAAIAYNCGEGCLRWSRLPSETRRYVRKIQ